MIYAYCRVSTTHQRIARQITNITAIYPNAVIIREFYTGTKQDRPNWNKLISQIKTTRKTRGMHWPFKGILLAEPEGSLKNPPTASFSQAAAKAAVFLCLVVLATRKRVYVFF